MSQPVTINLFANFSDQACSVALQTPRMMRYIASRMDWDGITLFVDGEMYGMVAATVRSRYRIGWLMEARCLHPENYERAPAVAHLFDAIMTHDAALLALGPPFVKTIRGGSWVAIDAWGLPEKTRGASMILSHKRGTAGHRLRHAIADAGLPIDLFGPAHTPIGHDTADAYRDYRFAVVTEACQEDNYFTEHLLDAIACGCEVFYWGCPNIADYLPNASIYPITDVADLARQLAAPPKRPHGATLRAIQRRARAYVVTEDWMVAEGPLRPYIEALR